MATYTDTVERFDDLESADAVIGPACVRIAFNIIMDDFEKVPDGGRVHIISDLHSASWPNNRQTVREAVRYKLLQVGVPFRLLDDDNVVMMHGLFIGDATSEEGFAPLDYYRDNYGCTAIQFYGAKGWETL